MTLTCVSVWCGSAARRSRTLHLSGGGSAQKSGSVTISVGRRGDHDSRLLSSSICAAPGRCRRAFCATESGTAGFCTTTQTQVATMPPAAAAASKAPRDGPSPTSCPPSARRAADIRGRAKRASDIAPARRLCPAGRREWAATTETLESGWAERVFVSHSEEEEEDKWMWGQSLVRLLHRHSEGRAGGDVPRYCNTST